MKQSARRRISQKDFSTCVKTKRRVSATVKTAGVPYMRGSTRSGSTSTLYYTVVSAQLSGCRRKGEAAARSQSSGTYYYLKSQLSPSLIETGREGEAGRERGEALCHLPRRPAGSCGHCTLVHAIRTQGSTTFSVYLRAVNGGHHVEMGVLRENNAR